MRTPESYQVDLVDSHGRIQRSDTFHDAAEAREYAQAQRTRHDGLSPMTTTV